MASEDTSLLSTPEDNGVYLRFSDFRKSIILAMVSGCTMINCTLIYSASESHLISNTRFSGWIVYTFHTTDCKGPRFIRRACQVIKYLFRKTGYNSYFLSLAASMSVFASALGALIVASYSTFCKFSLNPVLFFLNLVSTTTRWTQTCLSIHLTRLCNRFGWRSCFTKYSLSLVLEVFPVYWRFNWSGDRCSCHWRYI